MSYPVTLYIYDLSQGMARSLGPSLGLANLEGVWHTAIVVHNTEIFFGGSGIEHCPPGRTMLGEPLEKKSLGNTSIDMESLTAYIRQIGQSEYHGSRYDLFKHNCNNFSSSLTKFLGVQDIPAHILALPDYVMSSPIASILRPIIEQATPDGQGTAFTSSVNSNQSSGDTSAESKHFLPSEYSVINVPLDVEKVMSKIIEFNEIATYRLNDEQLSTIRLLAEQDFKIDQDTIDKIICPITKEWVKEHTFPIWHFVSYNIMQNGTTTELAKSLYQIIKTMLTKSDSPHTRMCLRILVNFFRTESSRIVMQQNHEYIIADINTLVEESEAEMSPQVENAVAAIALNYSKLFSDSRENQIEPSFQLLSSIVSVLLPKFKGPEASFKLVAAAATLLKLDREIIDLALALEFPQLLTRIPKGRMCKLDECVRQCQAILTK